ncbi:ribonuclease BN [Sphaerospermopsis reniformis]|uniref:Ribonuclease BN n=1 Tax=Sphaerospermopsis reniformis TaxID=531300 RepID=A0A479ZWN2_9CYAN|nr:ribonuclease BN [Sphaerospermopsis reniformis]
MLISPLMGSILVNQEVTEAQDIIQKRSQAITEYLQLKWQVSDARISTQIGTEVSPQDTRPFWKAKLISLGLTIGTILLLMLASFLVFISDLLLGMLVRGNPYLGFLLPLWKLLLWPLALMIVAATFSLVYRYGPSVWKPGTPLMPGAVLAAIFWALVSALFRLYVTNFGNYNKVYGTVGTFIVLMLWLWMSAFVLLVCNQLNVIVGDSMTVKTGN